MNSNKGKTPQIGGILSKTAKRELDIDKLSNTMLKQAERSVDKESLKKEKTETVRTNATLDRSLYEQMLIHKSRSKLELSAQINKALTLWFKCGCP